MKVLFKGSLENQKTRNNYSAQKAFLASGIALPLICTGGITIADRFFCNERTTKKQFGIFFIIVSLLSLFSTYGYFKKKFAEKNNTNND